MASARQSSLYERRYQYQSPFSGETRRILAPRSVGLSSVVRQQASGELDVMISRYNNGLIGNEEMKSFLTSQANNQYLSESDRAQVQEKLVDFDALIEKDRLEAVFKAAPEASLEKANAAIALSEFYTKRASSMVPGTPAYLQAQENAATWNQNVQAIQESVNKKQLSNYETSMMQQINTLQTSSSERSSAMATMYSKLADLATQQGDQETANEYIAKQRQQETMASQYAEAEQEQMTKKEMKQYIAEQEAKIAQLKDRSPEELQAKTELAYDLAEKYSQMGDQYNATKYYTQYVQAKEKVDKVSGDSALSAGTSDWDASDDEYKKVVKQVQKDLASGKITMEQYAGAISEITNSRKEDIDQRIAYLDSLDPDTRIKVNGSRKRAEDILNSYSLELDSSSGLGYGDKSEDGGLNQKLNDFRSGNVVAVVVPPSEISASGKTSKSGSAIATIQFVNKDNLNDENGQPLYAEDENGLFHKIIRETIPLNQEQANQAALNNGYYMDTQGNSQRVLYDSAGRPYIYGAKQKVEVYNPGSSKRILQDYVKDQPVKSWMGTQDEIQTAAEQAYEEKIRSEKEKKIKQDEIQKTGGLVEQIAQKTDKILPKTVVSPIPLQRTIPEQAKQTIEAIAKSPGQVALEVGKNIVGELADTDLGQQVQQTIKPATQQIQQTAQRAQQAVQPAVQQVQRAVQPAVNTAQQVYNKLPEPIKQAPIVAAYNYVAPKVQQAVAPVVQKAKETAQKIATTVTSTSPFSWLKSKLGW